VDHEGFAEGNYTFLSSGDGTLEEEEVILDDTVVGETTKGSDGLLRDVVLCAGIVVLLTEANTVDLFVDLRSVMVAILTSTRDREHDLRRMPCADTGDLPETLVGFSWKLLGSPTMGNALETVTLGNGNNIDVFVLLEDGGDINCLLEEAVSIANLVGY